MGCGAGAAFAWGGGAFAGPGAAFVFAWGGIALKAGGGAAFGPCHGCSAQGWLLYTYGGNLNHAGRGSKWQQPAILPWHNVFPCAWAGMLDSR